MSALKPDTLPEGAPFAIGAAIVHALRSDPALAGVTVLDNPKRASDLQAGARIVFFEDQADKLIEQPGQSAKRTYSFTVGVINRTEQDRRGGACRLPGRQARCAQLPASNQRAGAAGSARHGRGRCALPA